MNDRVSFAKLLLPTRGEAMRETDRLVWELEQRRLIAELLMDYSHFVDRNDPQGLVARVFCEDVNQRRILNR